MFLSGLDTQPMFCLYRCSASSPGVRRCEPLTGFHLLPGEGQGSALTSWDNYSPAQQANQERRVPGLVP